VTRRPRAGALRVLHVDPRHGTGVNWQLSREPAQNPAPVSQPDPRKRQASPEAKPRPVNDQSDLGTGPRQASGDIRLGTGQAGSGRPGRAPDSLVLSRLMPPPQGRSRSVRSSDTRARAGVRLVSSRGVALRHTREGDEKDVRDRAGVEDVIHFARSLDERLPRAVGGGLALGADR
jgi:hypothetical protein